MFDNKINNNIERFLFRKKGHLFLSKHYKKIFEIFCNSKN